MSWKNQDKKLYQKFNFNDFDEATNFINNVAEIARQHNHHPTIKNTYATVELWLSTHDAGDVVTDKDKNFAGEVDKLLSAKKPTDAQITPKKVRMFADGGSRGNPGPSASGFVLLDDTDTVLVEKGEYLGITTNNQAEYQAVLQGLEEAARLGVQEVDVYLDSMLVVKQVQGQWKVKNRDLWPIHQAIKDIIKQFKHVKFTHVPREYNKLADAEVNKVLDSEAKKQT